jgi:hypothetical protein
MTVQELHYDFKTKINKIDTEKFRNFRRPEIDWVLNEAQEVFIKRVSQPRSGNMGFESYQRVIDDVRPLVVNPTIPLPVTLYKEGEYIAELPEDYMFFLSGFVKAQKDSCVKNKIRLYSSQHDDLVEESAFTKSSFEWEEVNYRLIGNGSILLFADDFTIQAVYVNYLRYPARISFAEVAPYKLPDGTNIAVDQTSELPDHTHREIVDLAVAIATGQIESNFQITLAKLKLVNDV